MTQEPEEAYRAGRLIQFGLRVRSRPAQEPEYQELIDRFLDRGSFRALVRETARGLGLIVLDVGRHGVVLAPAEGSVFALRPADFRPGSSGADDRLLDGLVQVAIAAVVFPRARDLEEEATIARPPVTVEEVEECLRSFCERLAAESQGQPDPTVSDEAAGLREAWRVYHHRIAAMETRDERRARRTTRRIIESNLERMRELGCFTRLEQEDEAAYQPTWRYQVLVQELAATTTHTLVRSILEGPDPEKGTR